MKKNILFCYIFFVSFPLLSIAQSIEPKSFELIPNSLQSRTEPRKDSEGRNCAIIKVDVVGMMGLKFEEAVGDVSYALNEYTVYVKGGTSSLTFSSPEQQKICIKLEDYGPQVEENQTYRLILETDSKTRSLVLYVSPRDAQVKVDGSSVILDSEGAGSINKPIGKYNYVVTAEGYKSEQGEVMLSDDEVRTIKEIVLQEETEQVSLKCNVLSAQLFVDGKSYGTVLDLEGYLELPNGKHDYRLTAEGYREFNGSINVQVGNKGIDIEMEKLEEKIIKYKDERTKTSLRLRSHGDLSLSGLYFTDLHSTKLYRTALNFNEYSAGFLCFRQGIAIGVGDVSSKDAAIFDNYNDDSKVYPLYLDINLQMGFLIPLSKYNTSHFVALVGGYGSYYNVGHKGSNSNNNTVYTEIYDYGIRINTIFYINKFILGLEWNKSLANPSDTHSRDLKNYMGVTIGKRFYF